MPGWQFSRWNNHISHTLIKKKFSGAPVTIISAWYWNLVFTFNIGNETDVQFLSAFISYYLPTGLFIFKCCIFMHQFMVSPDTDSWNFINMKKQCQKKKVRYMWRLWLTKVNSTQTMDNLYLNFHQEKREIKHCSFTS